MKKLFLFLVLLISLASNAQMELDHSYSGGECLTQMVYLGSNNQRFGVVIVGTGGGKVISSGVLERNDYNILTFDSYNSITTIIFNTGMTQTGYVNSAYTSGNHAVRSFIITLNDTVYGNQINYQIPGGALVPPTLELNSITAILSTTATANYGVTSDGGSTVTARGVCWSSTGTPDINSSHTSDGTGTGYYASYMTGLSQNTTYNVRSYATNSSGTAYSDQLSFTTKKNVTFPTLTTTAASAILYTEAYSGGNITNDGGGTIIERGVCYNTTGTPIETENTIYGGSGTGEFISHLTELSQGITYYVRAWARNVDDSGGFITYRLAYGNQISFTTLSSGSTPSVSTISASSITHNSATAGGNVTSEGSSSVTRRGICYGLSQNPDTLSNKIVDPSSGLGTYYASLQYLSPSTTYYVRAWAKNSYGASYGNQVSFTTTSAGTVPTLTTNAITSVTSNSAVSGGVISSDGGSAIDHKGVQWSLVSNFSTIVGSTDNGTGTTNFTSNITGLNCGTTYYVRSYAHNTIGYGYGSTTSFIPNHSDYSVLLSIWYSVTTPNCGTTSTLASFNDACTALSQYTSPSCGTPRYASGNAIRVESYAVGKQIYDYGGCELHFTGYFIDGFSSITASSKIVYLINGVIQSITSCP